MTATLLGITKIDRTPEVDLSKPAVITGEARIIDSRGYETTLCFYEATSNGIDNPLGVKDEGDLSLIMYDEHEDGEAYYEAGVLIYLDDMRALEQALCDAIYDIDLRASQAAEDAWMQVWVDAAVAAEKV